MLVGATSSGMDGLVVAGATASRGRTWPSADTHVPPGPTHGACCALSRHGPEAALPTTTTTAIPATSSGRATSAATAHGHFLRGGFGTRGVPRGL